MLQCVAAQYGSISMCFVLFDSIKEFLISAKCPRGGGLSMPEVSEEFVGQF